jgi:hypothetical protein
MVTSWKFLFTTCLIHTTNRFLKTPLTCTIIYAYFMTICGYIIVSIRNTFNLCHISFHNIFVPFWFFEYSMYSDQIHLFS